jgi:hypothetical protein
VVRVAGWRLAQEVSDWTGRDCAQVAARPRTEADVENLGLWAKD